MKKHHAVTTAVVIVVLGALVYLQFRTWRAFNWKQFLAVSGDLFTTSHGLIHLAIAISLIYAGYYIRAIRWKLYLRPVKHVPVSRLVAPQYVGFAGLAILGRPGELIRPYLIGKREGLSFSSQLAVWSVERIFDMGAFAILLAWNILIAPPSLRANPYYPALQKGSWFLLAGIAVVATVAVVLRRSGPLGSAFVLRVFNFAPAFARKLASKVEAFAEGLNTIHNLSSFLQLAGLSLLMWFMIALAYLEVLHAYAAPLLRMHLGHVMLVMGSSMVGSMLQLPAVGGGSQLATISMMHSVLNVPEALAVSAGIMLWMVTFMAVLPVGFFFARREGLSVLKLSEESEKSEENAEARADFTV